MNKESTKEKAVEYGRMKESATYDNFKVLDTICL